MPADTYGTPPNGSEPPPNGDDQTKSDVKINFDKVEAHSGDRLRAYGLTTSDARNAVQQDIQRRIAGGTFRATQEHSLSYETTVSGVRVQYRVIRLPDGQLNIGTIFPVRWSVRPMTSDERELTLRILRDSGVGVDALSSLPMVRRIAPEDLASYHIAFAYTDNPIPDGGYVVLRDWRARDRDGASLELLALGGGDGRIYEIEISRLDQLPILELPPPHQWT